MNSMIATSQSHVSYSAITSWMTCGERYRLTKVAGAREIPAWWSIGGSAVHEATEIVDRSATPGLVDIERVFLDAFERLTLAQTKNAPKYPTRASRGQDDTWWLKNGPLMVQRWLDWRDGVKWQLWTLPDGSPAVEVPVTATIAGTAIKAYIDRVFITTSGELIVLDLKTGSRKPASNMQLGIYALLLDKVFKARPETGCYWLGRAGTITEPVVLEKYSEDFLAHYVTGLEAAKQAEIYLPNVGSFCGSCGVSYACWAMSGPEARRYAHSNMTVATATIESSR